MYVTLKFKSWKDQYRAYDIQRQNVYTPHISKLGTDLLLDWPLSPGEKRRGGEAAILLFHKNICLSLIFSCVKRVNVKLHLLGLCSAFKCQPLDDMTSLTSNISTTLDPNATIVISGLPIINNSGISSILHIKRLSLSKSKHHLPPPPKPEREKHRWK